KYLKNFKNTLLYLPHKRLNTDKKGIKPENESALPFLRGIQGDRLERSTNNGFRVRRGLFAIFKT
ncbi:MAG: hypothetical protein ACKO5Q_04595, partial [Microcystaceae cyanobacterium]